MKILQSFFDFDYTQFKGHGHNCITRFVNL
jgi:hypothetical protein